MKSNLYEGDTSIKQTQFHSANGVRFREIPLYAHKPLKSIQKLVVGVMKKSTRMYHSNILLLNILEKSNLRLKC